MSESTIIHDLPDVVVKNERWPSPVWLIPLVALFIGIWLLVQAWYQRGPIIIVQFSSAEGLEIGKTDVKYKAVSVGKIKSLHLSDDLKGIEAEIELNREIGRHLGSDARFWIVSPRINRSGVSGLSTLVSGAYIGMDPGTNTDDQRFYQGDERPPAIAPSENGRRFFLLAESMGSVDIGAPITYKQLPVGEVIDYKLLADKNLVRLEVFIRDPYFEFVHDNSHFWNASGAHFKLGASGAELRVESLTSLLLGGVAFDTPLSDGKSGVSKEGKEFTLYKNFDVTQEQEYAYSLRYTMHFQGSIRGLGVGANVEYQGIPVGKVESIDMKLNSDDLAVSIPVVVSIQPQRFDDDLSAEAAEKALHQLVKKGLRAKLETASFLTGQKVISLSMEDNAKAMDIKKVGDSFVFPTIAGDFDDLAGMASNIMTSLQETLDGVKKLVNSGKLDKTVDNVNKVLLETEQAIKAAKDTLKTVDKQTLPSVQRDLDKITADLGATLQKIQGSMAQIDRLTAQNSPTQYQLQEMLEEVTAASRSVRSLTETLQRQPTSLIRGKKGDE